MWWLCSGCAPSHIFKRSSQPPPNAQRAPGPYILYLLNRVIGHGMHYETYLILQFRKLPRTFRCLVHFRRTERANLQNIASTRSVRFLLFRCTRSVCIRPTAVYRSFRRRGAPPVAHVKWLAYTFGHCFPVPLTLSNTYIVPSSKLSDRMMFRFAILCCSTGNINIMVHALVTRWTILIP